MHIKLSLNANDGGDDDDDDDDDSKLEKLTNTNCKSQRLHNSSTFQSNHKESLSHFECPIIAGGQLGAVTGGAVRPLRRGRQSRTSPSRQRQQRE